MPAGSYNLDPVLTHQPADPAVPDWQAQISQLLRHTRAPITLQAEPMLLTNMGQKHHVVPLGLADRSCSPSTEATRGDLQDTV